MRRRKGVPTVTREDIVRGLVEVGLEGGDAVLVHSSLSSFGRVQGGADAVVDAILEAVGPEGTVVFPTFTGDAFAEFMLNEGGTKETAVFPEWTGVKIADLARPEEQHIFTGAIPKEARRRCDFLRGFHPMYSICAKGPLALELVAFNDRYIFPSAEKKFVHLLGLKGGKVLLLGVDHASNSAIHLISEFAGLEYKVQDKAYWLLTVEEYLQMPRRRQQELYALHMGLNLEYRMEKHFDRIEEPLRAAGLIRFATVGNAKLRLMRIADLLRVGLEAVKRDPWFLVSKLDEDEM